MKKIRITRPIFSIIDAAICSILLLLVFRSVYWQYSLANKVPVVEISTSSNSNMIYKKSYAFTTDWFSEHIPVWEQVLGSYAGKANLKYLEIGVFEGRAVIWMFENILTDPTSKAVVLDLFEGFYNDIYPDFAKRFFDNVRILDVGDRLSTISGFSQVEIRKLPIDSFDIIYIDGSHENSDVLEDAILCLKLLKDGGILIFDDYGRKQPKFDAPKLGIDAFYHFFKDNLEVLHNDHQVIFRKITKEKI